MTTDIRRIGVLVGDTDPVVEHDLQRYLPAHISFHVGRLDMPREPRLAADESLQMMCDSAPEAGRKVAMAEPEIILFACTSASFFRGPGWDQSVASCITEATGVPAMTTARAVVQALHALGARRIFLVTPYPPEVNAREVGFLADGDIEVTGQMSFGCRLSREASLIPPAQLAAGILAQRDEIRGNDALLVSCTMLRIMEVTEALEDALGLPVVGSNAASLWAILRALGEDTAAIKAGRLFHLGRLRRARESAADGGKAHSDIRATE